MRVKDFTTKVGSGVTPRGGAEVYQDHGVPLFRSQNVTNDGFLLDDIAYISEEIDESMSGTRVKPNDVLLNITGASIGRCYYTPTSFERGNVNQHVCIIRPTKKVIAPYLYYNLISDNGQRQIDLTQTGSNREGLTKENICNFEFEIPSLDTQRSIVSYLDSHVSSIDKRVSLLATKRDHYLRLKTAIINRAVTQGLNPDVKMKDSGVEWIGMIPEHWNVKRGKDTIHILYGYPADSDKFSDGEGIPLIRIRDIDSETTDATYTGEYPKMYEINTGDLLVGMDGDFNVSKWKGKKALLNQRVCKLSAKKIMCQDYLAYVITFPLKEINLQKVLTTVKHLSAFDIEQLSLPIAPLSEQQAIATYLDEKCTKIDAIVENLNQQIEKHKLLKRALINEVITGQRAV